MAFKLYRGYHLEMEPEEVKDALENGGGGDLSTCQMTLHCDVNPDYAPFFAVAKYDEYDIEFTGVMAEGYHTDGGVTVTLTLVLYKGQQLVDTHPYINVQVSGNAEYISDLHRIIITGDCGITITEA